VNLTKPGLSPAELVQEAVGCLPAELESALADPSSGFRRWTIRDFFRAYSSGQTTPVTVTIFFTTEDCVVDLLGDQLFSFQHCLFC
jgi:hypothetical protein